MSFCGNFPFFHSWQYRIREWIQDASTGKPTLAVGRWCPCGVGEIYKDPYWHPDQYWYGWTHHKKVDDPIAFLKSKLQLYGIERHLQNYQNIDDSCFEGTKDNFLVKSSVNKSVLCKIVTDVLKTQEYIYHEYTRYRVFTFKITPTQVVEELLLATFRIDDILNPIMGLMNKK